MNPNLPDPGENGSASELDARAAIRFRERVAETARAAWIANSAAFVDGYVRDQGESVVTHHDVIESAEEFERTLRDYVKNGAL
jgi:hypothetical protein